MACGTGKTFTALRLTEQQTPKNGLVLFLAPSISLVSQTLREWSAQALEPFHAFVVCSDSKVGKEEEDIKTHDLAYPATTDAKALAKTANLLTKDRRTVVFCTYQSIQVISDFAPQVRFGSQVEETSKGIVAHFAAPEKAVIAAQQRAVPAWIVMPRYKAASPAQLRPLDRSRAFMQLVENAFNYAVFGAEGFHLLGSLVDRCQAFSFEYSNLEEAAALFGRLADGFAPAGSSD